MGVIWGSYLDKLRAGGPQAPQSSERVAKTPAGRRPSPVPHDDRRRRSVKKNKLMLRSNFGPRLESLFYMLTVWTELKGLCAITEQTASAHEVHCARWATSSAHQVNGRAM